MTEPEAIKHAGPEGAKPSPEPRPDPRIAIMQSQVGDPTAAEMAFASVVEEFQGDLTRYAAAIAGSQQAEDVVQETFLKAWLAMDRFVPEGENSFAAWLTRIARNAAFDNRRKEQGNVDHRAEGEVGEQDFEADHSTQNQHGDPVEHIYFVDAASTLGQLEKSWLEVLRLRIMGFSPPEIAELQGISTSAVHGRLHRGRRAAKRLLNEADVI